MIEVILYIVGGLFLFFLGIAMIVVIVQALWEFIKSSAGFFYGLAIIILILCLHGVMFVINL